MLKKNDLLTVKIEDINYLGLGVARHNGIVIFVQGGVTEDCLEIKIIKVARQYCVARIQKIITASQHRISPSCPYFPRCGGCIYQHITNEYENELKRQRVLNEFRRFGILGLDVPPVISAKTSAYRNKLQCPVSENGDMGFYASRTHDIIPIEKCELQAELTTPIYRFISKALKDNPIPEIRHVYIRCGVATGEVMVCFVSKAKSFKGDRELAKAIMEKHPEVKSVILNFNPDNTNVILGKSCRTLAGKDSIDDELLGLRFTVNPLSFYQVNHSCTELLYKKAAELADIKDNETVADIYCGIGTIGLCVTSGKNIKKLIGVEIIPEAVENARKNAEQNGVKNAEFICSAAESCDFGSPDVLIVDPPRKGCDPSLINYIGKIMPNRIIYISCSPDTLARDCSLLSEHGYKITAVQPFNMFQRTEHVESVVCLTQNKT